MTGIQYRSDIQGLRAIAVLAVMVFHFNPALLPGGFVGVDIFLAISGFLIASILFNKKKQENYRPIATLTYFYLSRFKRLSPAYFSTLIVVSLLAAVLFLPADFKIYKEGLEKAAYFNSNNYFANFGDYFAPANHEQPLLHTWSLAIEVQFYLIAPFIFLLLPKRLLNWLLPISIIVLTTYAEYRLRILGQEQATYYSLSARIPAFFIGAWVALLASNKNYLRGGGVFKLAGGLTNHNCFVLAQTDRLLSWYCWVDADRRSGITHTKQNQEPYKRMFIQQAISMDRDYILLTLPMALASFSHNTLLHRCRNTQLAIQSSLYCFNLVLGVCQLLLGRETIES